MIAEYGGGFSHRFREIIYIDDSWKQDMSKNQIVYSTEHGRMCPNCGQSVAACNCSQQQKKAVQDGFVRVRREIKGRRGKTVTTITGIPLTDNELQELASELKRRIGTGGSVKDGVIIIQGDHRELITSILNDKGFRVKRAGG